LSDGKKKVMKSGNQTVKRKKDKKIKRKNEEMRKDARDRQRRSRTGCPHIPLVPRLMAVYAPAPRLSRLPHLATLN
jgi:hypothetical protein